MKKIYFAALATVFVAGSAIGQTNQNARMEGVPDSKHTDTRTTTLIKPASVADESKAAVIWFNNCDNAADWAFTNTSIPALDWSIEPSPAAIPRADLSPFASTSASDGFLFINSDGIPGNTDGNNTPTEVSAINATPIDLTGEPLVVLTFEQNRRWWQDTREVRVSGDNGATWTTFSMTDATGYPVNQNTMNPQKEAINISSIAGDSSEVLIEFYYNDNDYWAWYWAVDDVKISQLEDNDLELISGHWSTASSAGTPYIPYSMIPQQQLNDINFYGLTQNIGAVSQPNTTLSAIVSGTGSGTFISAGTAIPAAASDTLMAGPLTGPGLANGPYDVFMSVESDSTDAAPDNNVLYSVWPFEVNTHVYAKDTGTYDGTFTTRDWDGDNSVDPMTIFTDFQIYNLDTVGSFDVIIATGTPVGLEMQYNITDPTGAPIFDGLTSPIPYYTVTAADITTGAGAEVWVNIPFVDPFGNDGIVLDPSLGNVWTFSVGNDLDSLFIGLSGDALADPGVWTTAGVSWYPADGSAQDYYSTSCPMIRLNMNVSVGLEEEVANLTLGQNIPNPFNASTKVPFSLINAAEVTFALSDVAGKIIERRDLGTLSSGEHSIDFDGSDLSDGIYYYSVIVDGKRTTKRLSIAK
jgi:hypothetical protein